MDEKSNRGEEQPVEISQQGKKSFFLFVKFFDSLIKRMDRAAAVDSWKE